MNNWFRENLPWYVNGTLVSEERAEMDRYLAAHPDAVKELAAYRTLTDHVKESWTVQVGRAPEVSKVMAQVRKSRPEHQRTLRQMLIAMWDRLGHFPRVAVGGGFALLLLQSVTIGLLMKDVRQLEGNYAQTRSLLGDADIGPFIMVTFRPETTELNVRTLLVSIGAVYVGGPTQLGDYFLYVPRDQIDHALAQVKESQYVESASLIAKVPLLKGRQ
jgi:hypothetical protein